MPELENRLLRCFASVFPGLSEDEIRNANTQSHGVWDSLSSVTLVAVVQEEFNLEIDLDTLPQLDSYLAFRKYLGRTLQAGE